MFERRIRIVVILLLIGAAVLLARAAQVQIAQHDEWAELANAELEKKFWLPAARGRILDVKGRVLAEDVPCFDAVVDYRVIQDPVDEKWLAVRAKARARDRDGYWTVPYETRLAWIEDEKKNVLGDLDDMWASLAAASGKSRAEIETTRREIVARVTQRQKVIWRKNYEAALEEYNQSPPPNWAERWLLGETHAAPTPEEFEKPIADETQLHLVLHNLSNDAYNWLARDGDRFPALRLQPAIARHYPYNEVAAHVIGRLASVTPDDLASDPFVGDESRSYRGSDLIGREGIEKLAEVRLRGTRGQVRARKRTDELTEATDPKSGQDVRCTIDIELQKSIQKCFEQVNFFNVDKTMSTLPMPGAAVVLDVATNEVRALVSYPSFDLNTYDQNYQKLTHDWLEQPLMNRATQYAQEPGSTVKTIVGMAGIMEGFITPTSTIECTGYLVLNGRRYSFGRCWTMSSFSLGHHQIPYSKPHPTGFLDYADAIERSCNVFFETVASKLEMEGLTAWMEKFGLGQPTGIGLPEVEGIVPLDFDKDPNADAGARTSTAWFAGIGQGYVNATPIQLADVVATIARRGIWMRPKLFSDPTLEPPFDRPDRVDLHLNQQAVDALHKGMIAVVNSPAGTGRQILYRPNKDNPARNDIRSDILIAGKTGSATAVPLTEPMFNPDGSPTLDEKGRQRQRIVPYGTPENPNPDVAWYRIANKTTGRGAHSWYIGFMPADKPTIAFAVFVQYGGSGGVAAGSVANRMVDVLIEQGYVKTSPVPPELQQ